MITAMQPPARQNDSAQQVSTLQQSDAICGGTIINVAVCACVSVRAAAANDA